MTLTHIHSVLTLCKQMAKENSIIENDLFD